MRPNPSWVLFSLLLIIILSCFVSEIHGSQKQAKSLVHLSKPKLKQIYGVDTSLFAVNTHGDHDVDDNVEEKNGIHEGLKERDRTGRLPGQPRVNFTQYGGYVTVDKTAGRSLYYYFAEAHYHQDSLPLLLWLNGGPGCSSLAYGAMQELGPFRVYSDGKTLYTNKYSWNYAANVLFLESPAGVGFSYSNRSSDYADSGDKKTAEDNYRFLVNWLKRFPEYKGRDFYISGESYAGHYVPQLAHTILHHNKRANKTIINLKGILIGNAVINDETDEKGMYDYLANHALISDHAANIIQSHCDFSPNATKQSPACSDAVDEANKDLYYIDIYNIYAPSCASSNLTAKPKKASLRNFDPCSDYYVLAYLNREDVQAALHANVTKLPYDWEPCSDVLKKWNDSPSTIIPLLREFMAKGLRVWIFSGDIDGRVPVTSTKYSIAKMNLPVKTEWHPWFFGGEVGGFTEVYKGDLTFATIREAGHQVPSYQPARALSLVKHFLDGTPLPDTTK
ncbi:Serine carboxypeptidase-like 40 [Morus notabilis]|uniref:Carboxypeptidase n=1 Tax=Morus notabilis TaxID=981085 RepID=W9RTL1_9ROSA|nr:serine carboxypeptidase-like 40 [Morus notabilis]EXB95303.1 Serine carboxypeptidase-like 40 [Morus notabilis]